MIFTDRYFMSLIDPLHMSASMGGGVASYFCLSLFIGVLSYGNALVAQYLGAGQHHVCARVLSQGILLMLCSLPMFAIAVFWVGKLFAVMGHPPEQLSLEVDYFQTIVWAAPFIFSNVCIGAYFCGIGQTHRVMVADILGVCVNVPLSYCLIFGKLGFPEMGITGAALGTVIGTGLSLLLFLCFYFEPKHRTQFSVMQSFVFDRTIFKRYVYFGFPSGLEIFLNVAAFNLFLLFFQSYGIHQGAAATIVFNWHTLAFVPMLGLNIGIISLVGRAIGANDRVQIGEVIRAGFLVGLGYASLLLLVFVLYRMPLVDVFMTSAIADPIIRDLAGDLMIGLAAYVLADALIIVVGGVLRGAGDTRWLMFCSVGLYWLMLAMQFVVIKVWMLSPRLSFALFVLLILVAAIAFLWRLRSGRWYKNHSGMAMLVS